MRRVSCIRGISPRRSFSSSTVAALCPSPNAAVPIAANTGRLVWRQRSIPPGILVVNCVHQESPGQFDVPRVIYTFQPPGVCDRSARGRCVVQLWWRRLRPGHGRTETVLAHEGSHMHDPPMIANWIATRRYESPSKKLGLWLRLTTLAHNISGTKVNGTDTLL